MNHCLDVHGTTCPVEPGPNDEAYRKAATELYERRSKSSLDDGDINVDRLVSGPVVSESDEGAYVAAWVWVRREEAGLPSLDEDAA